MRKPDQLQLPRIQGSHPHSVVLTQHLSARRQPGQELAWHRHCPFWHASELLQLPQASVVPQPSDALPHCRPSPLHVWG